MTRVTWFSGMMALVLVAVSPLGLVAADEGNRAGLVVQFSDGRVETRCVAFEGDEISGADLLTGSNLDVVIDPSKGMGITVCQIEGEGCAYPSEPCFCQCMGGGECGYWNYFYRDAGETEWAYSALGALLRQVGPGSVEAWVWGDGRMPPADDLTFEAICEPPMPAATPTPTPTLARTPTSRPTTPATAGSSPTDTPPRTLSPTATSAPPTPTPAPTADTAQALSSYWLFGLMVLVLAAVGAVIWRRRSGVAH